MVLCGSERATDNDKIMRKLTLPLAILLLAGCSEDPPHHMGNSGGSDSPGSGSAGTGTGSSDSGTSSGGDSGTGSGGTGSGGEPMLPDPEATLLERLNVKTVNVESGVQEGVSNWRIWGSKDLRIAPVYTAPGADCGTLVGFTSGDNASSRAHVAVLNSSDELVSVLNVGDGFECRGLAIEPDGHFAVLLWDKNDRIYVERFDASGASTWSGRTELTNSDNKPTDFGIGESRLEYGDGKYGAYYHVHSDDGHEGDTLKYVNAESGAESTEWGWGCSHSMSELLRFNEALNSFLPACVTDCYPGTEGGNFATDSIGGIYLNHNESKVLDVDAGCNGSVAGELGSAAISPTGWKLVFNAHQAQAGLGQNSYGPAKNQDIGFTSVASDLTASEVVWLTTTTDKDEADASIARLSIAGTPEERYVVGWSEPEGAYQLALLDSAGAFVEAPQNIANQAQWGRRDDPFRQHVNGDVVWAWFKNPGDSELQFARLKSGGVCSK